MLRGQSPYFNQLLPNISEDNEDILYQVESPFTKEVMKIYIEFLSSNDKDKMRDDVSTLTTDQLHEAIELAINYDCQLLRRLSSMSLYLKVPIDNRTGLIEFLQSHDQAVLNIDLSDLYDIICFWTEHNESFHEPFRKGVLGIEKNLFQQLFSIASCKGYLKTVNILRAYGEFLFAGNENNPFRQKIELPSQMIKPVNNDTSITS